MKVSTSSIVRPVVHSVNASIVTLVAALFLQSFVWADPLWASPQPTKDLSTITKGPVATASNSAGTNATPNAGMDPTPNVEDQPTVYVWDPYTPISVSYDCPLVYNNIKVSPSSPVTFNIQASDNDRKIPVGDNNPADYQIVTGPGNYNIVFSASGSGATGGTFGNGMTSQTVVASTPSSGNVYFTPNANWDGTTITVSAVINDVSTPPSPDQGTTKDPSQSTGMDGNTAMVWTLVKNTSCPTTLTQTSNTPPANTWHSAPAVYTYTAGAQPAPAYQNDTINESFGINTPYNFTMASLTAAWKSQHPQWNTPALVAANWFSSSNNGTFVLDANDQMSDQHSGFGDASLFTAAAVTAGAGYSKVQTYSCNNSALANYTITREVVGTTNNVQIKKG